MSKRTTTKAQRNGEADLPIAIRYGKAIADAGWSAIPNILLDFVTYLRYTTPDGEVLKVNDQEAFFLVMLLRRKRDNEDPACKLQSVRTQAPYGTRRHWVRKLKGMGLLFTRQVFYPPQEGQPPLPSHTEWDLENLLDNLLAVREVWLQGREEHRARGESGPYELPEDFTREIQLFPATAQRILEEYYGKYAAEGEKPKKQQRVPQEWVEVARRMQIPDVDGPSSGVQPYADPSAYGNNPHADESAYGMPFADPSAYRDGHLQTSARTTKESFQYPTVPLRVPINGAGDARTHLPLLDELSLDFSWEEQAEYVEFWVQRFVEGRKTQAANTALAKAFGRAFGFQRDGELVVEPGQDEYARLGGLAKEFQDLGGHVAVWRAACRMWGRELAGDPLAYLAQSLIQERNERREEKHERRKPGRRGTGRQGAGADWPPGSGYRRLPDDAPRDYLADPFVEGDRDEPESG